MTGARHPMFRWRRRLPREPAGRPPGRRLRQRGFVTVELAAAMPAVTLLLLVGMFAISAVTAQVRCVDAAREAALAAARGEAGRDAGLRFAPPESDITVDIGDGTVHAVVASTVRPLGGLLPPLTVSGEAVAATEPQGRP
jgi:hypothetical protein